MDFAGHLWLDKRPAFVTKQPSQTSADSGYQSALPKMGDFKKTSSFNQVDLSACDSLKTLSVGKAPSPAVPDWALCFARTDALMLSWRSQTLSKPPVKPRAQWGHQVKASGNVVSRVRATCRDPLYASAFLARRKPLEGESREMINEDDERRT